MKRTLLVRWWPERRHQSLTRRIRAKPGDVAAWVALVDAMQCEGALGPRESALARAHELRPDAHAVHAFAPGIAARGSAVFQYCAQEPLERLPLAVAEMVKWKTALQCAHTHDVSKGYFLDAEAVIAWQWDQVIYPLIRELDFTTVLDLACGHGRNTEFLRQHSREIHLVDINASCIAACRERFGDEKDGTRFHYHVTDGNNLRMLPEASLSLVYTWDSMVHFDKLIVRDYVQEIARVLQPGGSAFLHHSNYGAVAPHSDWASNPGTRSDMSAVLMQDYAAAAGLTVLRQELQGRAEGWGIDELDCASILRKP